MRAGLKGERIRIEVLSTVKSTMGSDIETWNLYREVWAQVNYVRGGERYSGSEILSDIDITFKIDYLPVINPKDYRIRYNGNIYDIMYPQEIGRREALLILAKARAITAMATGQGIDGSAQQGSPANQPVTSVEGRTGDVVLNEADIDSALGFDPSIRMGNFFAQSPSNSTITLIAYSLYGFTINEAFGLSTSSGTIDISVKINGVSVTGLDAITASSTEQNVPATAANAVSIGDEITVVLTNNSSAAALQFTLKGTL